jgi:prolyl-tRNA editing enzyme YbaK/EbsC (Cys-tRNA(Pro) deacylase)
VINAPGTLDWQPAAQRLDLLATPVAKALDASGFIDDVVAAEIDPDLADTAAFCARYAVELDQSANCVIVAGRRAGDISYAAAVLLATTRLDVNGVVRHRLGARKASFAPLSEAVELTAMEYGGITAVGVPSWPILIDAAVAACDVVIIGSGVRRSKLALPASRLAELAGAEVIDGLAGAVN